MSPQRGDEEGGRERILLQSALGSAEGTQGSQHLQRAD